MSDYLVVLSDEAVKDLMAAYKWYEEKRIHLGYEFELSIEAVIGQLSRNPLEVQKRYREVRVVYTERFPYGVHYLVEMKKVKIIAIFHTSRSSNNWFKRK